MEGNKTVNQDVETEEKVTGKQETEAGETETDKKGGIYYVKFLNPYFYEGKEYKGVDLEKIRDLTTKEKINIDRLYEQLEPVKSQTPVMTTMYAVCTAAHITKLPVEFFYKMKNIDFLQIERTIRRGFFSPV